MFDKGDFLMAEWVGCDAFRPMTDIAQEFFQQISSHFKAQTDFVPHFWKSVDFVPQIWK